MNGEKLVDKNGNVVPSELVNWRNIDGVNFAIQARADRHGTEIMQKLIKVMDIAMAELGYEQTLGDEQFLKSCGIKVDD